MNGRVEDRLSKGVQGMSSAGLMVPRRRRPAATRAARSTATSRSGARSSTGKVVSISDKQTVVIQREFLHRIPKYNRYERRRGKVHAHMSPCMEVKEGDVVTIAECRPLAKTISFVVVQARSGE